MGQKYLGAGVVAPIASRLEGMRDLRRCAVILCLFLGACGSGDDGTTDAMLDPGTDAADSTTDAGGSGLDASSVTDLEQLLADLRADPAGALLSQANGAGWPAAVEDGYLFATDNPAFTLVAGEHDSWQGTALTQDQGFQWIVLAVPAGNRYKFTDLLDWEADPWSRAYEWDQFGVMSMVPPTGAHLERFFEQRAGALAARTVRIWVPDGTATHVAYVHDGQNLFNPNAIWGGWHLHESAPTGMILVGVDNTGARLDEYTHVLDDPFGDGNIGGLGDDYADFVHNDVRALIDQHYGEPARVAVMGSSLGGLISYHIADRFPGEYDFAASLSGTMGWGSIGAGVSNETMIERYAAAGHRGTALYLDSGGQGTCVDSDGDGIMDDAADGADNYCENIQLRDTLSGVGYTDGVDLWHWYEPGAPHNEAAWADRVFRPLESFGGL